MRFGSQDGFRRNRHGHVWLHLPDLERNVIKSLLSQLSSMLAIPDPEPASDPLADLVGIESSASPPSDPALARLFPDAYEDPDESQEFRRYTMRDLRSGKLGNLQATLECIGRPDPTRLSQAECAAWLGALNDLRLTMGTRLEVSEDNLERFMNPTEDTATGSMFLVYDWLTYHQENLIQVLERGVRD